MTTNTFNVSTLILPGLEVNRFFLTRLYCGSNEILTLPLLQHEGFYNVDHVANNVLRPGQRPHACCKPQVWHVRHAASYEQVRELCRNTLIMS